MSQQSNILIHSFIQSVVIILIFFFFEWKLNYVLIRPHWAAGQIKQIKEKSLQLKIV